MYLVVPILFILMIHMSVSEDFYYRPQHIANGTAPHKRISSSLPAISKVYVINMKHRSDRMNFMIKRLHELKITFERFEAFDFGNGNPAKIKEAKKRFYPETKFNETLVGEFLKKFGTNFETWGAAASWQSHLQVHLDIYHSDLPGPFLILEDDIKISPKLIEFLSDESLNKKIPQDWEMILLDHLQLKCYDDTYKDNLCMVRFAWSIAAYVIRNKLAAEKLINIGNTPTFQVADHYTNYLYQEKILITYATIKKYAAQAQHHFVSDIRNKDRGQHNGYDSNIDE